MRRQQQTENLAAAKERHAGNENLLRKQQKVKQLMDRFNSLMEEGRYRLAEESVAAEVRQGIARAIPCRWRPRSVRGSVGYNEESMALRVARQKGVVDTLARSRRSHIPLPDDPPIVYPDAEVWQQLTARRKEKYSSMDLAKQGTAEKKINEALKSPTQLEFIETPLTDVIDYLKDYHEIEIQIDKKALDDVGIGTDTPVTKNLKGISLRSALRLMLHELEPDLHDPGRSAVDHHARGGRGPADHQGLPGGRPGDSDRSNMMGGMGGMWRRHDGRRHGWRRHGWHGRRHGRHGWRHGRHGMGGGMGGMGGGMGGMGDGSTCPATAAGSQDPARRLPGLLAVKATRPAPSKATSASAQALAATARPAQASASGAAKRPSQPRPGRQGRRRSRSRSPKAPIRRPVWEQVLRRATSRAGRGPRRRPPADERARSSTT